jgi:hypothetical protein
MATARRARRAVADRDENSIQRRAHMAKRVEHYHTPASSLDPHAELVVIRPEADDDDSVWSTDFQGWGNYDA